MLFFLSVAVAVLHYRGFGEDWQGGAAARLQTKRKKKNAAPGKGAA